MKIVIQSAGFLLALAIFSGLGSSVRADNPEPRDPLLMEAEELFRNNRFNECHEKLKEAAARDKTLPPAVLMMARLHFSSQQGGVGRLLLERALVEHPDHPEVYLTNASIALAEGRILDTLLSCQIALQQAGGVRWNAAQQKTFKTEAQAGLATAYEARKDWGNAARHLAAWLALDPKNVAVRQRLARALFLFGRIDEAERELRGAFAIDPKLDPVEVTIAQFYAQMVGPVEAPANDPMQRAAIEKKVAEYKAKAREWFKKAMEKRPDNQQLRYDYESFLYVMKEPNKLWELINEYLDGTIELDRFDPTFQFWLREKREQPNGGKGPDWSSTTWLDEWREMNSPEARRKLQLRMIKAFRDEVAPVDKQIAPFDPRQWTPSYKDLQDWLDGKRSRKKTIP